MTKPSSVAYWAAFAAAGQPISDAFVPCVFTHFVVNARA
jgi:hypothetical protein